MKSRHAIPLLLPVLFACTSSPLTLEKDPAIEEMFREQRLREQENATRQGQFSRILLTLDKMVDSYVFMLNERGDKSGEDQRRSVEDYLSEQVDGRFDIRAQRWVSGHYDQLVAAANNREIPGNQSIALAALGFSTRPETLSVLLNGIEDEDFNVSNSAVLGLALFKDARTPPLVLARCVDQPERPLSMRSNAAWALYQIQTSVVDTSDILDFWKTILDRPIAQTDPGILVSAVRGMGLSRDPELAGHVVKYISNPTPQVRMAVAIALGRMQNQTTFESLLTLLGPAETNPNVRLAARKALQALAGGTDRGYSVDQWRKVFERGS